jgi:hypothetical protein
MRVFGREPAFWLAFASAAIALFSATVFELTVDQQGVLNASVAAVFGVLTALAVSGEKAVPAIVGLFKAAGAVALAFGLSLSPEVQSTALVFIEILLTGLLVRPNVVAPVAPAPVGPVIQSV